MQNTWVRSLVWEDPTCCGAAEPGCHKSWACALQLGSHNYWAHLLRLLKPMRPRASARQPEKPPQGEAQAPQLERRPHSPQLERAHAAAKPQHSQNKRIDMETGLETSLRIYLVDITSVGGSLPVGLMTAGEFHPSLQTWLKQVWPMGTKQGQAWVASTLSPLLGSTPHFLDHYLQNETELGPFFPALNSHFFCLSFGLLC